MFVAFNEETASLEDRCAFTLSEIIDDRAPLYWTRHRATAWLIAKNTQLMEQLIELQKELKQSD